MLDLARHAEWPERLIATVERHRAHGFAWGTHDCATLFSECVEAVTDLNPLLAYGSWSSAASASRCLVASGFRSMEHLVETLFPEVPPSFAGRGDIGFTAETGPIACPFVIVGNEAVSQGEDGFLIVPREALVRTFKVG